MSSGPMRGRRNTRGCGCRDCCDDGPPSRAEEKRSWLSESEQEAAEHYRERMGRNRSREERLADLRDNAVNAPTIKREGK